MALVVDVVFLAIALAAALGTSLQLVAWSLEADQVRLGVPYLRAFPAMRQWLTYTAPLLRANNDRHPQVLDRQRRMATMAAWSWLSLSSFVGTLTAAIKVLVDCLQYGTTGFGYLCLTFAIIVSTAGRMLGDRTYYLVAPLLAAVGVMTLVTGFI